MPAIKLYADNLLLKKQEPKTKSQFVNTEGSDPTAPLYDVAFAGPETVCKAGDTVILKPGSYEAVRLDGEAYTFATSDQVAGKVGK